jgi:hypothetical protein
VHVTEEVNKTTNTALYFECGELDHEVGELKAGGLKFGQEPIDRSWLLREAYLQDANGNKICLVLRRRKSQKPALACKITICSL